MPDDLQSNGTPTNGNTGWMTDVQRAIAMILIGTFATATFVSTVCSIFWPQQAALIDMAKTLQAALVNMALIALGFFFGNNQAKAVADAGQQKIVEKLTSTAPPGPSGPVAPLPAPAIVPWWSKLVNGEAAAITAAAATDPEVMKFVTAANTGAATPEQLAYLVSKGLLTQERADAIQKG